VRVEGILERRDLRRLLLNSLRKVVDHRFQWRCIVCPFVTRGQGQVKDA
jgi:hypothetical protein